MSPPAWLYVDQCKIVLGCHDLTNSALCVFYYSSPLLPELMCDCLELWDEPVSVTTCRWLEWWLQISRVETQVICQRIGSRLKDVIFTSRVSGRGNKIGPVCVSVCLSVSQRSHSQTCDCLPGTVYQRKRTLCSKRFWITDAGGASTLGHFHTVLALSGEPVRGTPSISLISNFYYLQVDHLQKVFLLIFYEIDGEPVILLIK